VKILDRYILTSFLSTFATVFVILFFIFILQGIWLFIADLAGKDLDTYLIIKFLLFYSPKVVPLVLPLSVLLSSIMTFGNFAENYEFAAMKASGISLKRAMYSLAIFISGLSFVAFLFANNIIPQAEYEFVNLRKTIVQQKPSMAIAEGQFSKIGSYNIKVSKKHGENNNLLDDITIHRLSNFGVGANVIIKAKNGELIGDEKTNFLQLVLYNGNYYEDIQPKNFEDKKKLPFAKSSFKKYIINFDLAPLQKTDMNTDEITNTNTMLNVNELVYTIDSLETKKEKDIVSYTENIHQRIGLVNSKLVDKPKIKDTIIADLTSILKPYQVVQILEFAKGSVTNTKYSIDGSQYEFTGKIKNINNHWLALFDKFVIAYACLLMFFIGAPIGAIIRKGGLGLPIVFAMVVFIIYHFINVFGKKVAQENGIPPFLGSWMSSIILTPFAVLLTYRATNDIGLMLNFDWITVPFQKLFTPKNAEDDVLIETIVNLDALKIDEDEEFEKLNHYTDDSLINIVKNSKQFNYSSDFRNKALKILSNRGITQQDLIDTHNLYNKEYLELDRLNQAYKVQSNITLVTYFIAMILSVLSSKLNPILILISIVTIILFYIFLYKSHQTIEEMGKLIGRKVNVGLVITFLVGFPFFILLHFYIKTVIKEAMTQYR